MPDYRLYFFDQAGQISHAKVLECADDAEAIREAAEDADGRAMELWRRAKLIRRFEVHAARARLGDAFIDCRDEAEIAEAALDQALAVARTDLGNVQLICGGKPHTLEIRSQRGFKQDFLDFFRFVSVSDPSACGRALLQRKPVVIEDILKDDDYRPFHAIALEAGYRSVQSTPLVSSNGLVRGVLSTHAPEPGRPSDGQLSALLTIGRAAADAIGRLGQAGRRAAQPLGSEA